MSLDAVLAEACDLLSSAVDDPSSALRVLTLATIAESGAPDLRSVILRACDPAGRRLSIHTDSRSGKVGQLRRLPMVALHGWDPARRLQLRLSGVAALHQNDDIASAAWAALSPLGRQLYRVRQTPGAEVPDPSPAHYGEYPEAAGYAFFTVVEIACHEIEVLRLAGHGQTRARFRREGERMTAAWLVP